MVSLNPILSAADWPYPANSVFNPGAVRLPDGNTLLLARVEDRRWHSHLCVARSPDGIGGWQIDPEPTLEPDPRRHPEELWGIEDPRVTFVPDLDKYVVAYTAYGWGGPSVALALTEDFRHFDRCGVVMSPEDKDAALFPRQIKGRWAMIHRPSTPMGAHIWISYSPDLYHWGGHKMVLRARRGGWWDANKIGLSPPLIETDRGWLMIYHGVRVTTSGCLYRIGLALLDLDALEEPPPSEEPSTALVPRMLVTELERRHSQELARVTTERDTAQAQVVELSRQVGELTGRLQEVRRTWWQRLLGR